MEGWPGSLCRTAPRRRGPGPGGANRRQPTWPLAARKQPRAYQGTAKQLLRFTRPGFRRGTAVRIIRRTAVYGPVRTVVWEGRSREAPPYPDCDAKLRPGKGVQQVNDGGPVRGGAYHQ